MFARLLLLLARNDWRGPRQIILMLPRNCWPKWPTSWLPRWSTTTTMMAVNLPSTNTRVATSTVLPAAATQPPTRSKRLPVRSVITSTRQSRKLVITMFVTKRPATATDTATTSTVTTSASLQSARLANLFHRRPLTSQCRGLGPWSVLTFSALPPAAIVSYQFDWYSCGRIEPVKVDFESVETSPPTRPPSV